MNKTSSRIIATVVPARSQRRREEDKRAGPRVPAPRRWQRPLGQQRRPVGVAGAPGPDGAGRRRGAQAPSAFLAALFVCIYRSSSAWRGIPGVARHADRACDHHIICDGLLRPRGLLQAQDQSTKNWMASTATPLQPLPETERPSKWRQHIQTYSPECRYTARMEPHGVMDMAAATTPNEVEAH